MKLRSFFYALAASVLVMLLIGAIGFYWLVAQSPLTLLSGGRQVDPAAAMFVPKQAPVMVSLLVNPDRLEAFRQVVARPEDRRASRAEVEQLKQNLLANTGLDYEQDIKPWLAEEITLAVTAPDIDRDSGNGQQPGYLLAIATQDPERSREFLQLFWQKQAVAGIDLVFEQYAGVKLIYGNTSNREKQELNDPPTSYSPLNLASAVVGDRFVLFANHPKVLREAITNVQAPDLSLKSSSTYQQALQSLSSRRVGLSFVNLPRLAAWLGKGSKVTTLGEATQNGAEASRLYESLVIALQLDRQGLVAETALLAAAGHTITPVEPALSKPVEALQYIPAMVPFAAAGQDLKQLWEQVSAGLSGYEALATLLNQPLADLQARWGVDLPADVFSSVPGKYALGLIPRSNQTEFDWVFVTEKPTDPRDESVVERLDAIARQQGLSTGPITLGHQQISAWTRLSTAPVGATQDQKLLALQAQVEGVHTTVGNYEIFATSVEAMDSALQAPENSLLKAEAFQQAIAPLSNANDGYLYVDWSALRAPVERQVPLIKLVELAGKPFFSHLRSLTVTSYGSELEVQRGSVFVRLAGS